MSNRKKFTQLCGLSLIALSTGASAQAPARTADTNAAASPAGEADIIVTARRRDEAVQDVPISINTVSGADIGKLNLRQFEDIQTVVPGLTLANSANGTAAAASLRGVAFDPNASGANPSVEFYFNDGPISSNVLFTALFDVGQIEVLRGPQGTLRGRASPSGSITITSRPADLNAVGGYANMTGSSIGTINVNGAIGVPLIPGKLAVRLAGIVDHNEADRVKSINNGNDPYRRTEGVRGSFRFDPTDTLSFRGDYQRIMRNIRIYDQVESTGINATSPFATTTPIQASSRLSVLDTARPVKQLFQTYNLLASWQVAGQRLNYVGALTKQQIDQTEPGDLGDFFGPAYPAALQTYGRITTTHVNNQAHELRLSSDERVAGMFDYIVGGFWNRAISPTNFFIPTPVFLAAVTTPNPALPFIINPTYVGRTNRTLEKSVFGNITAHLGDKLEISGGARYINYKKKAGLAIGSTPTTLIDQPASGENATYHHVIYSAVGKYAFTPDLMAYASVGSSFRPGTSVIGDTSLARSARENGFLNIPPEKSTSYEIGFKSTLFDRRVRFNVSVFHQDFKNYPFRVSNPVFYVSNEVLRAGTPAVDLIRSFNFVGAVPVKITGAEAEASFQVTHRFNIGGSVAYAHSRIKNGLVPCNDFFPADGVPDAGGTVPTVAQIRTATGGDTLAACRVKYNPSLAPPLTGIIQAEYAQPFNPRLDGFLRTLASLYGKSKVDPSTTIDDVKAYGIINVYAGIRDPNGAWELSLFAKNLAKTERVLTRNASPFVTSYATLLGSQSGITSYRGGAATAGLSYTAPREFGVNLRYAFGSR